MTNSDLIGADPGWIILVKGVLIFAVCVVATLLSIWAERRIHFLAAELLSDSPDLRE